MTEQQVRKFLTTSRLPARIVGAAVVLAWLLALTLLWRGSDHRADQADVRVDALAQALAVEQSAAARAGRTPVAPPPATIIRSPQSAPTAVPSPQPTVDVAEVVRQVLAVLPRPRDGRDAPPPTQAQIEQAVEQVCARAGCGPTDAQVAAQVALYLTEHPPPPGATGPTGPTGPQGPPGEPGATGPAGVGIASISDIRQSGSECTITVTLTDGTSRDLTWQCQPTPPPTPTPTPTITLPGLGSN